MQCNHLIKLTVLIATIVLPQVAQARQASPALAKQAYTILMTNCYRCHGNQKRVEGLDVSARATLVAPDRSYIVPGDLGKSELWTRVGEYGDMPPKGNPEKLTDAEVEILKQWITSGAEFPPPEEPRVFLDERYVLVAIDQHLGSKVSRDNWKHQRYFSLAHLYNNPKVTDYHLRLYRAALSKVINSLSRQPAIVRPEPVDEKQTVFNIDIRRVGWTDPEQWLAVLREYPYGLEWNDTSINDLAKNVNERLGGGNRLKNLIPYVRADWFVAKASRPPLYNILIKLPDTDAKLEAELGVNFKNDFNNDNMARAAFTQSGVSRHNRLVDRHIGTNTGYFYRSHDFGKSFDRALLARFPLGPKFEGNSFDDQAYVQDGGEIVFRLANGLNGYMIVDGKGARIDEAPVSVVRDLTEISGTPAVVNGISCMGCHKHGIQPYQDNIRQFVVLGGEAGRKVNQIYRSNEEQLDLQRADKESFIAALDAATGRFLKQGEDKDKDIREFPEPIKEVAILHDSGVGLDEAAFELGMSNSAGLKAVINNATFQAMGLGPLLAKDNKIPRDMWDSTFDRGASVFQAVAREMGIAVPLTIPKNQN